MALPNILISRGEGGLQRPPASNDHYSGLLIFSNNIPNLWQTNWLTANSYLLNQIVYNPTQAAFYKCLEAHTSGTFSADLAANKWTAIEPDNEHRNKVFFTLSEAEQVGISSVLPETKLLHYHIAEFFRLNPNGYLQVGIYPSPSDGTYTAIFAMQQYANGELRQVAICTDVTGINTAHLLAMQSQADLLAQAGQPLSVVADFNILGSDPNTLPDLRTLNCPNVSVIVSQDGGAKGATLSAEMQKSVTCLGAVLGVISKSSVHQSVAWVKRFNFVTGNELSVYALATGQNGAYVTDAQLAAIVAKGYLVLRKHIGLSGTWLADSPTCTAQTSDYAYIENNRTIDKALRNVRKVLTPELNGPVRVEAESGKLARDYIEFLKALGDQALAQMARDGELSGFETFIDPQQNVLATSTVNITIRKVPIGVSRTFNVKLGFAQSLTN